MTTQAHQLMETHYPRVMCDGIQFRAVCTCGWAGHWTDNRKDAEYQWGAHGVKTIQRNVSRPSRFTIIGNPLAKKEAQ